VTTETAACPWAPGHALVLIGVQGRRPAPETRLPRRLTFLVDASASMMEPRKLPLLQTALKQLVDELGVQDQVAFAVHAAQGGLVLPPTSGARKSEIKAAIDRLDAGGAAGGGGGIRLAYRIAHAMYAKDAVNRVVLASDGNAEVGIASATELAHLVERERAEGIVLSTIAVGEGAAPNPALPWLAREGNGSYASVDSVSAARAALVREAGGSLVTIARDANIQVELNPRRVESYRLIGYDDAVSEGADSESDRKDAGEIAAGHGVTALYEIVPAAPPAMKGASVMTRAASGDELLAIHLRYQPPAGGPPRFLNVKVQESTAHAPSDDMRFAMAVAGFGLLLREPERAQGFGYPDVLELVRGSLAGDAEGYRNEFLGLVEQAVRLRRS
jgi:Ca-activated chloride channel homolog